MNLYLISQDQNKDYDTYDSAVVCAENEDKARMMHPSGAKDWNCISEDYPDWADSKNVDVELIGASIGSVSCVICASFNAG